MINLELGELYGFENEEELMDGIKEMQRVGLDDDFINAVLERSKVGRGVKTHEIKLNVEFCDDVLNGIKTFEIRKNDRNYKVGDLIKFLPWDPSSSKYAIHEVHDKTYKIKYILSGYGLQDGYIAMVIEGVEKNGRWIRTSEPCASTPVQHCSECGTNTNYDLPYCPNCGAKMDGGDTP